MMDRFKPAQWLCVFLLLVVMALSAATCSGYSSPSSPSTPGGNPTPTHSGY